MKGLYDQLHEIPIPDEAYINRYDARVFLIDPVDSKRTVIGKATCDTLMHPNSMFRKLYPEIFAAEYPNFNNPPGYEMKVGMYGLCLAASKASGLYDTLLSAYDPKYTNAIMDFCMYSIFTRKNVAQLYSARMKEEIVFSDEVYEDSWWSDFFKTRITETQHTDFRIKWLKQCQKTGVKRVWLCIDGSNNDCQMKESRYAEPGDNKSHSGKTIVGYIWAVDAESGMPVTYHVSPGGQVDSQAIQWLITFLNGYNFEVGGVILDKGFATIEVITLLNELKIPYVIMLPKCHGHNAIFEECGDSILGNPEYLINDKDLYGTSKSEQIWKKHPNTGIINLYYSSKRGHYQGSAFNEEIIREKESAEKACLSGKRPVIQKKYQEILQIEQDIEGKLTVRCDYQRWKKRLQGEGFFSILTSEDFGAKKAYEFYSLMMFSEVNFSMSKSQEGNDVTRVHSDPSMLSKLAIAFITTTLRHTIQKGCQATDLDTNVVIQKMDRVRLLVLDNGKMKLIRDIPGDLKTIFEFFGLYYENFEAIAQEINHRYTDKMHRQVRELPVINKPEPGKRGRKPGSKNKKTIEREQAEAEARARGEVVGKEPARRGRHPGTKDSMPRKKRSDAGKKRGSYKKRNSV